MSTPDPLKQAEAAALAKINQEKGWLTANKAWLLAVVCALVVGVIVAKLV